MLTGFFGKSKPIHFVLIGLVMVVGFCLVNFVYTQAEPSAFVWWQKALFLPVYLFLMVLINFIVKRSNVTQKNTFTIGIFAMFTMSFLPVLSADFKLLGALFLLLALRRLIAMRTGLHLAQKLFDASFWVVAASLCYPPAFFYMILPITGILIYTPEKLKNWWIPIVAIASMLVLTTAYYLVLENRFFNPLELIQQPDLSWAHYTSIKVFIPLLVWCLFSIAMVFFYFGFIQGATKKQKRDRYLIFMTWGISLAVVLASYQKNGSELLFFGIPLSIMSASYFEQKGQKRLKEVLLLMLLLLCVLPYFLTA